jgi:hypothetical protein
MDPLSIAVGSLQVVSLCAQSTVALAQWIGDVKNVDERIDAFSTEIKALSATYEALNHSLRSPAVLKAAIASEHSSGGQLWRQIASLAKDCENTMAILNQILESLSTSSGNVFRRPYRQFRESLVSGDISRLRQRIQLFNSTLTLPLQMITV